MMGILTPYAVDDSNYGTASAATKGAAQDEAALQAYNDLRRERNEQTPTICKVARIVT